MLSIKLNIITPWSLSLTPQISLFQVESHSHSFIHSSVLGFKFICCWLYQSYCTLFRVLLHFSFSFNFNSVSFHSLCIRLSLLCWVVRLQMFLSCGLTCFHTCGRFLLFWWTHGILLLVQWFKERKMWRLVCRSN